MSLFNSKHTVEHIVDPKLVSSLGSSFSKKKGLLALAGLTAGAGAIGLGHSVGKNVGDKLTGQKHAAVSKEQLKEVLKKHEARETPEQEADESPEEQKIEREAGVEKHAFWQGFAKQAMDEEKKKRWMHAGAGVAGAALGAGLAHKAVTSPRLTKAIGGVAGGLGAILAARHYIKSKEEPKMAFNENPVMGY